jgi:hypothetical protein
MPASAARVAAMHQQHWNCAVACRCVGHCTGSYLPRRIRRISALVRSFSLIAKRDAIAGLFSPNLQRASTLAPACTSSRTICTQQQATHQQGTSRQQFSTPTDCTASDGCQAMAVMFGRPTVCWLGGTWDAAAVHAGSCKQAQKVPKTHGQTANNSTV